MKKRINLLVKQEKYVRLEHSLNNLKWILLFLVIIFVGCYAVMTFLLFRQKGVIDNLSQDKKILLEFLLVNDKTEAKFVYFRSKENQLSDILKEDVNFYPYYQLLDNTLKTTAPLALLEAVAINKERETVFTLSFPDPNSMLTFFKFAESDEFLENFNQLILSQFSQTQLEGQNYQLIFKGTFVALNEN